MKVMSEGQNVVELFSVLLTEVEALELIEGLSRQLKRRKDFKFSEFGCLEVQSDSDESGESFAALIHFPTVEPAGTSHKTEFDPMLNT